ncbi:MAG: hypothetical protein ABSG13_06160 [Bryobacteraceae bacterium]|jgi:hypothetical protein
MIPAQRLFLLFALFSTAAHAQWLNFPTPGTPRTPDGKPNLSAPSPRTADGKPDLSGVWHVQTLSIAEMRRLFGSGLVDGALTLSVPGMELDTISKYAVNILVDFKPEETLMRPEAAELFRRRGTGVENREVCLPIGIPLAGLVSEGTKIVQSPRLTVIMYESDGTHRQIYTDGRALPKEIVQPAWLGYSAGKWDRDTLVVESAGFNDKTWLDVSGHPHSEALRIVERYHRRDFGRLDVEVTLDDPQMYTKPFTIKFTYQLLADADIFENICENEKDRAHTGKN